MLKMSDVYMIRFRLKIFWKFILDRQKMPEVARKKLPAFDDSSVDETQTVCLLLVGTSWQQVNLQFSESLDYL